ncbi:MAG TPA: PaaI family thioesterase [Actinomycetota bacterium]|nr:PaaI family thioesterase [Actinomycetota bacterium]
MNTELIEGLISGAPLPSLLGIRLDRCDKDVAVLRMPFKEQLVTIADVVHGGAISALIDTTATAAAWATDELPENMRGTTVALTVNFLTAARATDLTATGRVVRRGRSLCFLEVTVTAADGNAVATGLITYKLG